MDLTVPALVLASAHTLKAPAQEFLKRVSGPAADEIGEWLRDKVHAYRSGNAVRTVAAAEAKLAAVQREPREVPLRLLLPVLQGASLEDDLLLSDKWASLLASAADPEFSGILPSFPHVLGYLSPADAALLDFMFTHARMGGTVTASDGQEIDRGWILKEEILSHLGMSTDHFELSFANLAGLGLVEVGGRAFGSTLMTVLDKREICLTTLGEAFVKACSHGMSAKPNAPVG